MHDRFYVEDPETGEEILIDPAELDEGVLPEFKPIGGFCYQAEDFLKLKLPKAPFYIQDWLPKHGKLVMYAPAKHGKSYLATQLARVIGAGDEFLGKTTEQGVVLYIQSELGHRILQDRMLSTGKDYENVVVGTIFSLKIDSDGGKETLLRAIESIKPNVIILDPLYKMINGDENDTQEMRQTIDTLDELLDAGAEQDMSLVVIHHTGKDITRGGRGSSVIEDWADSYVEMRKISKDGEPLTIRLTPKALRHAELPPKPIEAILDNFEFTACGETETCYDRVQNYFLTHPDKEITSGELYLLNPASRTPVNESLKTLMSKSLVVKLRRGVYQLDR